MIASFKLVTHKMNNAKLIRVLISGVLLAFLACNMAHADMNPAHYLNPAICTPPSPPAPGQPGYGATNPLGNGIYWDPVAGMWFIPDGLYNGNDAERDIAFIEDALTPPPPQRPDWAIFDMGSNGTYYFMGGYYNGNYYSEGYYLPDEIH